MCINLGDDSKLRGETSTLDDISGDQNGPGRLKGWAKSEKTEFNRRKRLVLSLGSQKQLYKLRLAGEVWQGISLWGKDLEVLANE